MLFPTGLWDLLIFAPVFGQVEPFINDYLGVIPGLGILFRGPPMGIGMLTAGIVLGLPYISVGAQHPEQRAVVLGGEAHGPAVETESDRCFHVAPTRDPASGERALSEQAAGPLDENQQKCKWNVLARCDQIGKPRLPRPSASQ